MRIAKIQASYTVNLVIFKYTIKCMGAGGVGRQCMEVCIIHMSDLLNGISAKYLVANQDM